METMAQDVFVSYSNKDKIIADTIVASLEQNQIRCWYAPRDIKPSEDWGKAITDAIEVSRVFLLIFSGNANRSQHVLDELNLAISSGIPILPFRVENLEPGGAMRLHLSSRHWLDAFDPSWENHLKKLIQTVSAASDQGLIPEAVQIPTAARRQAAARKKAWVGRIGVGILAVALVIFAGWYGLSKWNPPEGQTRDSNLPPAEQGQATPVENEGLPDTTPPSSEETSAPTQEITPTLEEQEQATQEPPAETCRIVFFSTRSGDPNLWLMDPDGANPTQLSFNQYEETIGSWSLDGSEFIFFSWRDGDEEIFIMNADGTNIRQLTDNVFDDVMPKLSPDGARIAFYSNRGGGGFEMFSMALDGGDLQQLTTDHGFYRNDYEFGPPTPFGWSPDGARLVFVSDQDGDPEIFIMDRDGGNITQLTYNENFETWPSWSPAGDQIVFVSDRDGDFEIFVMNIDGSGASQLTSNNGVSQDPAWSPTGKRIAFSSDRSGDFEIWKMDPDGSGQTQLTFSEGHDGGPIWSPLCK